MRNEFKGQVALVTGGASGIGAAIVRELFAGGASIVIADKHGAAARALAHELGPRTIACQVDVTQVDEVQDMVALTVSTFGGLNLAVNNAGISGPKNRIADLEPEQWRRLIDVNLSSVFYCLKYEIDAMIKAGGGAIVNTASIAGIVGLTGRADYVAAKHGVVGLTRTAALDYASDGIRVNAIAPGGIETPLIQGSLDESRRRNLASAHPLGRLGKAEEVAGLATFLLSDRASFITGSIHMVDGGFTAT